VIPPALTKEGSEFLRSLLATGFPYWVTQSYKKTFKDCHPERSPARFCFAPDFSGRGTQFEGSALGLD